MSSHVMYHPTKLFIMKRFVGDNNMRRHERYIYFVCQNILILLDGPMANFANNPTSLREPPQDTLGTNAKMSVQPPLHPNTKVQPSIAASPAIAPEMLPPMTKSTMVPAAQASRARTDSRLQKKQLCLPPERTEGTNETKGMLRDPVTDNMCSLHTSCVQLSNPTAIRSCVQCAC